MGEGGGALRFVREGHIDELVAVCPARQGVLGGYTREAGEREFDFGRGQIYVL